VVVQDGTRAYRRLIRIETAAPGVVFAALEDTAHHVRVTLTFDGDQVVSVTGEAVRLPWVTCPAAAGGLASLVGTSLTSSLAQLRRRYAPSIHCTHFFDLAQLTLAHAARGVDRRTYEIVSRCVGSSTIARLRRDGEGILEWTVDGGTITTPERFAGVGLRQGFVRWCEANLDEDAAEAAFVLRRATSMTVVANLRMDDYSVVTDSGLPAGTCFTSQPERRMVAFRQTGSQRDYSSSSQRMLEGFEEARDRVADRRA
jgi:hypothetical protein